MPKEKSTLDFLNNIDSAIADETFKEEAAVEETPEEEVEEERAEKRLPFNKDPKVQRYIDEEIDKRLRFRPSEEQRFKQEVQDEINLPPSLVKLVGNDTPEKREALKELSTYLESLPQKAQEQFLEQQQEQARAAAQQDEEAVDELNAGFEEIEDSFGVDLNSRASQKTRGEFIEYLRKVSHKNSDGEVDQFADIPAAWEEFQERQKPEATNSRAKQLASRGMTRSTDTSTAPKAGNSWKDVDRYFDTLNKNN